MKIAKMSDAMKEVATKMQENIGMKKIMGVCPLCKAEPILVYTEDPDGLRWHHECKLVPSWFGNMAEWVGLKRRLEKGMSYGAAKGNIELGMRLSADSDGKKIK